RSLHAIARLTGEAFRHFPHSHRQSATPSLVVGAERRTTDFLGTGAGPMAFARHRGLVVGRAQPTQTGTRSPGSDAKAVALGLVVMPPFGAVRTIANQV